MAKEIERRFLVVPRHLPLNVIQHGKNRAQITQGYLSADPVVRVRTKTSLTSGSSRGFLTVKGPGIKEHDEFEYEVPSADAAGMLKLCKGILEKTRYTFGAGGHIWEVDQFHGIHVGLWLAEIELSNPDEPFETHDWLDSEVTEDPRYTNVALAMAGCVPA